MMTQRWPHLWQIMRITFKKPFYRRLQYFSLFKLKRQKCVILYGAYSMVHHPEYKLNYKRSQWFQITSKKTSETFWVIWLRGSSSSTGIIKYEIIINGQNGWKIFSAPQIVKKKFKILKLLSTEMEHFWSTCS